MTVEAKALAPRWQARYAVGDHSGVADTAKSGGGDAGLRPHELLEAALATCLTITARMVLAARNLPDDEVAVSVEVVRQPDATVFRHTLDLPASLESERAALMAHLERCPVRTTLSRPISFVAAQRVAGGQQPRSGGVVAPITRVLMS